MRVMRLGGVVRVFRQARIGFKLPYNSITNLICRSITRTRGPGGKTRGKPSHHLTSEPGEVQFLQFCNMTRHYNLTPYNLGITGRDFVTRMSQIAWFIQASVMQFD